jgi:hypothetical protein
VLYHCSTIFRYFVVVIGAFLNAPGDIQAARNVSLMPFCQWISYGYSAIILFQSLSYHFTVCNYSHYVCCVTAFIYGFRASLVSFSGLFGNGHSIAIPRTKHGILLQVVLMIGGL